MKNKGQERWRAKKEEQYFYIEEAHGYWVFFPAWESNESIDDYRHKAWNYFQTEEEADNAASDIQKVLRRHAGGLHDFQWALEQMKQGKKVCRKGWEDPGKYPMCMAIGYEGYEEDRKYLVCFSKYDPAYGIAHKLEEADITATDWKILAE